MDIRPIRTEDDYQAALLEAERLMESALDEFESDRLDVLATLIEAYESKHVPIPLPDDPVQVLEYYLESRGLERADLIPFLGSRERVSEVLNRKRSLSLAMIRRLHLGLGIPAELLIGAGAKRTTGHNQVTPPAQTVASTGASRLGRRS